MKNKLQKLKSRDNCFSTIGAICFGSIVLAIIVLYSIVFTNPEWFNDKPGTMLILPAAIFIMMIGAACLDEGNRIKQLLNPQT